MRGPRTPRSWPRATPPSPPCAARGPTRTPSCWPCWTPGWTRRWQVWTSTTDRVARSVVLSRPTPLLLGPRAPALLLHPAHLGALRGPGRPAGGLVAQALVQLGGQPIERHLAVASLGPGLRGAGAHHRSEAVQQPGPLTRAERGRGGDVELHLHSAERAVGVLAAGPARRGGAPGDLGQGHVESPAHVQHLRSGHGTSVRGPGYAPVHGLPPPRTLWHGSLGPLLRELDHPRQPGRGGGRGGVREGRARRRDHHLRHG